jgi:thioredoxin 1
LRILASTVIALMVFGALGCGANSRTSEPGEQPAKPTEAGGEPETMVADMATASNLPKLWDFTATWCPPCQELKPIVEELEKEYEGTIEIKSIDVDQNGELAGKFGVKAIPTLVFLDAEGNELTRHVGFWPKDSLVAQFEELGFIETE